MPRLRGARPLFVRDLQSRANFCRTERFHTGPEARRRVQTLRRLSDAIMVGGETVRQDHPQLTVREPESWPRQPLRIIASRSMDDEEVASYFPDGNFERVELETNEEWHSLLIRLGARNITCLLIEGGGELAAAAIALSDILK